MADTALHEAARPAASGRSPRSRWCVGCSPRSSPDSSCRVYNLKTIATQTVIVGLGAIGMTFVIVAGGIDLSVGLRDRARRRW